LHLRRRHSAVALLVWAFHLVLGVWHGVSGDHRMCAPTGQLVPLAQANHAGCAADDMLAGAAPAPDAPSLIQPAPEPPPAFEPATRAPSLVTDVLAYAPKASPPPLS